MEPSSILAITQALKSAVDITKGIYSHKNQTEVQASIIELNSKLIEAQQAIFSINSDYSEAQIKIQELEDKLDSFNIWAEESRRYILMSPWPGTPVSVYHLKKSESNGELPHWLCPNCFQAGQKSILNTNPTGSRLVSLTCSVCKASIQTPYNRIGGPQYAEDIEQK